MSWKSGKVEKIEFPCALCLIVPGPAYLEPWSALVRRGSHGLKPRMVLSGMGAGGRIKFRPATIPEGQGGVSWPTLL